VIEIFISLIAIYGLAFLIKESDGPWGIMAWARNRLINNKYVGVFFFKLFDCYFCIGCHCGWIVYLLSQDNYKIQSFILWTLAGGAISLILDTLMSRLQRE
jgi:hypothetical protein